MNQLYNQIYNIYKSHYQDREVIDNNGKLVGKVIEYKHNNSGYEQLKIIDNE